MHVAYDSKSNVNILVVFKHFFLHRYVYLAHSVLQKWFLA